MSDAPALDMYVIYKFPEDHPESYVIRRWSLVGSTLTPHEATPVPTYEEAVALIPQTLFRIVRSDTDEPAVLETWL